jgi:hypothetical protein
MKLRKNLRYQALFAYATAVVLSLLLLVPILRLWQASLIIPFSYVADGIFNSTIVKGMIDNGWYLHNPYLGVPTGMDLYDFPMADNLHFLLLKVVTLLFPNYSMAMNLFYVITFPLICICSLLVFRQLGIGYGPSIVMSLLYAFLPYHFYRGQAHLFLSCYYSIPLMILLCIWIMCNRYLKPNENLRDRFSINKLSFGKILSMSIICLAISASGVYYAFFGCFLVFVIVINIIAKQLPLRHLLVPLGVIVLIAGLLVINLAPSIHFRWSQGKNRETARRSRLESEMYGMKIIQLVLPISAHRIPFLAKLRAKYDRSFPLVNENGIASLGLVGSAGFLGLLGGMLFRRRGEDEGVLGHIELLNICAVLLGTIGGFGALFAFLVSPNIRAYNRISVYIGFFSLLAVGIFLDKLGRHRVFQRRKLLFGVLLTCVLVAGVLDQTSTAFIPDYGALAQRFHVDARFVQQIEALLPSQAMIYQLPYVPFPENPQVHHMYDYDHFRGYLHSRSLRWSYGAVRGRDGDRWLRQLASQPVKAQVAAISERGFSGVYVDSFGYPDGGESVRTELTRILRINPVLSDDQRLAFFQLMPVVSQLGTP